MNNSPEKRKELAQRLRTAGCAVTTVGEDWLSTGDFAVTPAAAPDVPAAAAPEHDPDPPLLHEGLLWEIESRYYGTGEVARARGPLCPDAMTELRYRSERMNESSGDTREVRDSDLVGPYQGSLVCPECGKALRFASASRQVGEVRDEAEKRLDAAERRARRQR
ncbi:MAG TPA: hypothetical protein VG370_19620 [Chloroflexota bacterium]|jgi:hypothetical protein|nr:hypothetical protein [Chloroflexota bacterium]